MKAILGWILAAATLAAGPAPQDPGKKAPPDAPAKPHHDGKAGLPTPGDQGSSPQDVDLTKRIRSEVTDCKDLSIKAKNVKIITMAGKVTLRGAVASQAEQDLIEGIARKHAGDANVTSLLEVKASGKGH